jgi:hypothetical protein
VRALLRWLGYTPAQLGDAPPLLASADPPDRAVGYAPAPGCKLDPRAAIAGGRPAARVHAHAQLWLACRRGWLQAGPLPPPPPAP